MLANATVLRRSSPRSAPRAHQNRESNEEGGDVNVAAERSDWSIRMNLSSLHALTEQHLSQTAGEFESVTSPTHQRLSVSDSRTDTKGRRERKKRRIGYKRSNFFIYLFTSCKKGNAIDKHEIGDIDAHRLRCRHGGVYVRQNAGTPSLSIKKLIQKKIIDARCL